MHGGGSCQFSLSSKSGSQDPKDWKVIQTLIGGCPATVNGEGNLVTLDPIVNAFGIPDGVHCASSTSNQTDCVRSLNIDIPKGVPSGVYSFAWTWFNKVGNREMYMGCAPVQITGGGNDTGYMDTLPSIFMANILPWDQYRQTTNPNGVGSNITHVDAVLGFPNPGLFVNVSNNIRDKVSEAILGDLPTNDNAPVSGSGGTIPYPEYYITYTNSRMVLNATGSPNSSYVVPAPTASVTPAASPAAPVMGSGACPFGRVPCPAGSVDGGLVCVTSTQWAICDRGCMQPAAVAAGTIRVNGQIVAAPLNKRWTEESDPTSEPDGGHGNVWKT